MHHLVIGEGQIGRAIIERALADGDEVTVLRRTSVPSSPGIRRVSGDVLDPAALAEAITGADAVQACFHAPYDARLWARDLPPRELAVLDAAADRGIPVVFPESMYGFQGEAADLVEGAEPTPRDPKGAVRTTLLAQRRDHRARTLSLVAADLIGPSAVGTGAAVVCTMILERLGAGSRPIAIGDPAAPHSLTSIPDLAVAMLHAARRAEHLAPDGDAVLHAPSAPARSQSELIAAASALRGIRERRPLRIPRLALRLLAPVSTLARELHGIGDLWYRPCVLRPGVLSTQEGLAPTPWEESVRVTAEAVDAARARAGTEGSTTATTVAP
ncbi:NAD(P)H-binding protein [Brachybacterium sp. YJGR34]|uniref:NAD(P)H-binding protein n=1 Tax=Brachybacterium sp. YJGR34 TaxID=2059911 RepID=UPI000E0C6A87|nr:NAD(P)H-binding protein [Brachybacterium sp. YJGR34]